jgi:hypothetical protein
LFLVVWTFYIFLNLYDKWGSNTDERVSVLVIAATVGGYLKTLLVTLPIRFAFNRGHRRKWLIAGLVMASVTSISLRYRCDQPEIAG